MTLEQFAERVIRRVAEKNRVWQRESINLGPFVAELRDLFDLALEDGQELLDKLSSGPGRLKIDSVVERTMIHLHATRYFLQNIS